MTVPALCIGCEVGPVETLLDFGLQPLCNRFLATEFEEEYTHPLVMGQCEACGLIQIQHPVPAGEMRSRFDWIVYREPEEHLDDLAGLISRLPGITRASTICGMSFVDDSLLRRLAERGFQVWRLDPETDLGIHELPVGVETIQERFDPRMADKIAARRGKPDVVIGRYIVEHAHDLRRFMDALKNLVSPHGYIVVEVPDCQSGFKKRDYSIVWEEHVSYFTEATLRRTFALGGYSLLDFESYPYALQNALVIIGKPQPETPSAAPMEDDLEDEKRLWKSWIHDLAKKRQSLREFFREHRRNRGKLALLGAGQRGCSFVNLLELKEYLDFVVDDNTRKHGLFMPGSRLPIRQPSALLEEQASLCLIAANPESQGNVMRAHKVFLGQGGTFLSIYPDGPYALPL